MSGRNSRLCSAAFAVTVLIIGHPVNGAVLVHESGNFGGQRGATMDFGSLSDPGWIRHYSTWPAAELDEIHLYSPTQGEAFVKTLQEATIDLDGANLAIWQHGRVTSESYPWPLGTVNRDWYVGSGSGGQAHADAVSQELAFRIEPEGDEQIGDPIRFTLNANLTVNHRLNDQIYHEWTEIDIGSDGSIDYAMKGQIDGGFPNPYTVFLTPHGSTEPQVAAQAAENYTRSATVFHNQIAEAQIGDLITFAGGPLVWQTVNTSVSGNEKVTSDMQFSMDVHLSAAGGSSSSVVMDHSFDDLDNFDETGFEFHSEEGGGTASLENDPAGNPGDQVLRLFDPEGAVWISQVIDCQSVLDIELEYWFPTEGKLTILLAGEELATVESTGVPTPTYSQFRESFVLADWGLIPGEMLWELKLSNPWNPDPDLYLDNLRVTTAPEPASSLLLLVGCLGLLRRRA